MPRTREAAKNGRSKPELEFSRTLTPAISKRQTRSGGRANVLQKKLGQTFRQQKKAASDASGKKILEEIEEIPTVQQNKTTDERVEVNDADELADFDAGSVSKEEALRQLREFDFTYKYGPITNITRLERFNRAEKFGLNPPGEIRILLEHFVKVDESVNLPIWSSYPL